MSNDKEVARSEALKATTNFPNTVGTCPLCRFTVSAVLSADSPAGFQNLEVECNDCTFNANWDDWYIGTTYITAMERVKRWVNELKRAEWGLRDESGFRKYIANTYNDGVFGIFDRDAGFETPIIQSPSGNCYEVIIAYLDRDEN